MRWRNAGRKTLAEVRNLLGRICLKLEGDQFPTGLIDPQLVAELQIPVTKRVEPASLVVPTMDSGTVLLRGASAEVQRSLVIATSELQLSARARGVLKSAGVSYLGELAQLTQHSVMRLRNSGRKTARELSDALAKHNLNFGMTIPDWSRSVVKDIRRRFHAEMSQIRKYEDMSLLASLGPEPQVLEEELARIASALDNVRNAGIIISLWGWGGVPPRTLDSIGKEFNLTRERVRQIEARTLKRLAMH
jgi:hypothetical protein